MSECRLKLQSEGKPYPRTCPICKFGACQMGYSDEPHQVSGSVWIVDGDLGKMVAVLTEAEADYLHGLIGGRVEQVDLVKIQVPPAKEGAAE